MSLVRAAHHTCRAKGLEGRNRKGKIREGKGERWSELKEGSEQCRGNCNGNEGNLRSGEEGGREKNHGREEGKEEIG